MKVRRPHFDFSDALPHWCPDLEFGAAWNAASMILPILEPFLNRVMIKARSEINGADAASVALKEELAIFVSQEGVHYKIHDAYNAVLRRHYPDLAKTEAKMAAYFSKQLKAQSMRFLTGFCESFELVGPIYAKLWLDSFDADGLLSRSQPVVVDMWKWHWSEEYEHRTSCYRAHKQYSFNYPYRMYMLGYTLNVLKKFQYEMTDYMLEVDRAGMTPAQRQASIANERRWKNVTTRNMLPPLLSAALPFYSPVNMPEPENYRRYITRFESQYV
jgi:predicted metal-dependent hydrolase